MRVSNYFPGLVWSRSVHNIVIDFLLWNGLSFLSYFAWFGFQLNKYVNSVESVIGLFMVSALLIHGMLEFPLFYSYFLLPAGFILGILLSQKNRYCTAASVSELYVFLLYRDYEVIVPKLNQAIRYDSKMSKQNNHNQIYVLEESDQRIDWIRMNPYSKLIKE